MIGGWQLRHKAARTPHGLQFISFSPLHISFPISSFFFGSHHNLFLICLRFYCSFFSSWVVNHSAFTHARASTFFFSFSSYACVLFDQSRCIRCLSIIPYAFHREKCSPRTYIISFGLYIETNFWYIFLFFSTPFERDIYNIIITEIREMNLVKRNYLIVGAFESWPFYPEEKWK